MANIIIKQGEAKTITFTVTDNDATAVDCSSTTCTFTVASSFGGTALITKVDADFDKTDAATGILTINISDTESDIDPMNYFSELKIVFSAINIDKSVTINFIVQNSVD